MGWLEEGFGGLDIHASPRDQAIRGLMAWRSSPAAAHVCRSLDRSVPTQTRSWMLDLGRRRSAEYHRTVSSV